MKIKISGSSGYLGTMISTELKRKNHDVSALHKELLYDSLESLTENIRGADVVISLAGAPILQRWTKHNRQLIYNSRVSTTKNIVKAINNLPEHQRPKKFISISAIGIYKTGIQHDETSLQFEEGFVGETVKDWEAASDGLSESTSKIIFRTGLVLGKKSKIIRQLLLPFKLGLGATIGNGNQPFPFIREKDVVNAFVWATEKYKGNNIFNLVAPEIITNKEFTHTFARSLHRPAFLFIPGWFFRLIYGEASVMITQAPLVIPGKLPEAGFQFEYPTLKSALEDII